jgi:DNA-binding NarL/FixJ family response regulator
MEVAGVGFMQALSVSAELQAQTAWDCVVTGRWSLTDRFESDARYYIVAQRNAAGVETVRALTQHEQEIVRGATLGHSNKYMAYELGISQSSVSQFLKNARRKLGVSPRSQLCQVVRCLCSTDSNWSFKTEREFVLSCPMAKVGVPAGLSRSEQDIFRGILEDLSNAQIAARRGRSPRTIANQVASMLRKLRASSRTELVAKQFAHVTST